MQQASDTGASVTITCPHCGAPNRAPRARLDAGDRPKCGKCHHPLFDGHPAELATVENFDRLVQRTEIPVLVDFWAAWCGPCRVMAPQFAGAAEMLEPHLRLAKLDTEAAPEVAERYAIRSIPTLVLFQHGREIARRSGAMQAGMIVDFVREALAQGRL